jgi:hypothetical protein
MFTYTVVFEPGEGEVADPAEADYECSPEEKRCCHSLLVGSVTGLYIMF